MKLARVIGTVWATRKPSGFEGLKLLLIQPVAPSTDGPGADGGGDATSTLRATGNQLAACDSVGAGPGELVYYVDQYEATLAFPERPLVPIDAAIVGIVDRLDDATAEVLGAAARGEAGA